MKQGTSARGYGWGHQKARALAIRDMQDGQPCTRCGQGMWTSQARWLDLDHAAGKRGYRGLAHRRCNRQAGQAAGMASRRAASALTTQVRSRSW